MLAGVLVAGGVGWAVGANVQSPADAAAARNPPPASLVTSPVERRTLTSTVVTRGTVEFGSPQQLVLAGAVGSTESAGGGAGATTASAQRVTKPPAAGQTLAEGAAVMEVNGRPVFVLTGAVPMYRTIGPGREGKDVEQLQKALERMGFKPGKADGKFSVDTATAVRKWYQSKGYAAQEPSVTEKQQLHALEQAAQSATMAQLDAKAAAGAAGGDPTLQLKLKYANQNLATAKNDLADYQRQLGTTVPAGEVIFLPALPVRMTEVTAQTGQNVEGKVGTVTSSTMVIQANATKDDVDLLKEGMKADIETADGKTAKATVTALREKARLDKGDKPQGDSSNQPVPGGNPPDTAAGGAIPLLVAPDDPAAWGSEAGGTVKVSIVVGSTSDKVLVVPVAAVTTGADGQSRLQVEREGGTVDVGVKVGLAALGHVEVSPLPGGTLSEGDRVVVGTA